MVFLPIFLVLRMGTGTIRSCWGKVASCQHSPTTWQRLTNHMSYMAIQHIHSLEYCLEVLETHQRGPKWQLLILPCPKYVRALNGASRRSSDCGLFWATRRAWRCSKSQWPVITSLVPSFATLETASTQTRYQSTSNSSQFLWTNISIWWKPWKPRIKMISKHKKLK